jgi:hypothetical protein
MHILQASYVSEVSDFGQCVTGPRFVADRSCLHEVADLSCFMTVTAGQCHGSGSHWPHSKEAGFNPKPVYVGFVVEKVAV